MATEDGEEIPVSETEDITDILENLKNKINALEEKLKEKRVRSVSTRTQTGSNPLISRTSRSQTSTTTTSRSSTHGLTSSVTC